MKTPTNEDYSDGWPKRLTEWYYTREMGYRVAYVQTWHERTKFEPTHTGACYACGAPVCEVQADERHSKRVAFSPPKPVKKVWSKDAWGFADFLCFRLDRPGFVAVNACQKGEIAAHVRKFRLLTYAYEFLKACSDNRLVIAGWTKPANRYGTPSLEIRQMELHEFVYKDWEFCEWIPPKNRVGRVTPAATSSGPGPANTKTAGTDRGAATSRRGSSKTSAKTATSNQDMPLWTAAAS